MSTTKLAKRDSHHSWDPWPLSTRKFFEDFLDERWGLADRIFGNNWVPAVDVEETKDEYLIKAEMPGMKKEDVKISLTDNMLTLSGEKKTESKTDDKRFHRMERSYGAFQRSFALATPVKGDKVSAVFKDGILEIRVPKSEDAKSKEIDIKID